MRKKEKYMKAKLTGRVFDTRFSEGKDGDVFFFLEDSKGQFTISLKNVLDCLRLAEGQKEIKPLPSDFWETAIKRYPDLYKGFEGINWDM